MDHPHYHHHHHHPQQLDPATAAPGAAPTSAAAASAAEEAQSSAAPRVTLPQALLTHYLAHRASASASTSTSPSTQPFRSSFAFGEPSPSGQGPSASIPRSSTSTDPATRTRPLQRNASINISELLRSAAQAELIRMQDLQEQRRRRSTSAVIHPHPAINASMPSSSTATATAAAAAAAASHKRQWEDTVSSDGFLEQAGAVAHEFNEFFGKERAWADMALAAAVARRTSSIATTTTTASSTSASASGSGSRNSITSSYMSSGTPRSSLVGSGVLGAVGEGAGAGYLRSPIQLMHESSSPFVADRAEMPPPMKRVRTSVAQSDGSAHEYFTMMTPSASIPAIVMTSATPESSIAAVSPQSMSRSSTAHTQYSTSHAGPQGATASPVSGMRPMEDDADEQQQEDEAPLADPPAPSRSGSLVSLLSNFAQMLEGRQQVALGLEALARDGAQLMHHNTTTAPASEEEAAAQGAGSTTTNNEVQSPSGASVEMSEWTESSSMVTGSLAATADAGTAGGSAMVPGGSLGGPVMLRRASQRILGTIDGYGEEEDDQDEETKDEDHKAEAVGAADERRTAVAPPASTSVSPSLETLPASPTAAPAAASLMTRSHSASPSSASTSSSPPSSGSNLRFGSRWDPARSSPLVSTTTSGARYSRQALPLHRRSRSASPALAGPGSAGSSSMSKSRRAGMVVRATTPTLFSHSDRGGAETMAAAGAPLLESAASSRPATTALSSPPLSCSRVFPEREPEAEVQQPAVGVLRPPVPRRSLDLASQLPPASTTQQQRGHVVSGWCAWRVKGLSSSSTSRGGR